MADEEHEHEPRLLRGIALSEELEERVRQRSEVVRRDTGRRPTGAVVGWTSDPTTGRHIEGKRRRFESAGLDLISVVLDPSDGTAAVLQRIDELNEDETIDGILVQFPIPQALPKAPVVNRVARGKDIDGGSRASRERLREGLQCYVPATAEAVLRVLGAHEVELEGRRVVVVGGQRSIAEPVALLLERVGARVTPVEAEGDDPEDWAAAVRGGEIVVAAAGRPHSVASDWLPSGCILVDTGYYHGGGRGDVAPGLGMTRVASWVPPVGGVGPVTVALLMEHTLQAAERHD